MQVMAAFLSLSLDTVSHPGQRAVASQLLHYGLASQFDLHPADIELERNSFGRPSLQGVRNVHFSISHCDRAVIVLVADTAVGVDIETVRAYDRHAARRVLHPQELARVENSAEPDREFFRHWTLKESYAKALGVGMSYPMRQLRFDVSPAGVVSSNRPTAGFLLEERFDGLVVAACRLRSATAPLISIETVPWPT